MRRGCLLSAAAFGLYHWFSYGVLGSLVPMVFVFLLTAGFGLMLSVAFAKSGSLAMPVGLHLGWNLVSILVFSDGPIGPQLLVPSTSVVEAPPSAQWLTTNLLLPLALPAFTLWLLHAKLDRAAGAAPGGSSRERRGRS